MGRGTAAHALEEAAREASHKARYAHSNLVHDVLVHALRHERLKMFLCCGVNQPCVDAAGDECRELAVELWHAQQLDREAHHAPHDEVLGSSSQPLETSTPYKDAGTDYQEGKGECSAEDESSADVDGDGRHGACGGGGVGSSACV
eukprot:CAMPEP_0202081740 /NCGR_PEP_ID=MMETSP0964-20121228/15792_1 /ASSEMBLY_ACC=CAM_ASM_000500 /TAXON_ID=4773 /ORGANISM="Schizochytrium aggregatum, Strain ATCC28209" /LENGTH=145 /DNA_ID=CAMNT_0048649319 /DNA_START=422 /DNA_END=855 /DNA_ORIENTATION=-